MAGRSAAVGTVVLRKVGLDDDSISKNMANTHQTSIDQRRSALQTAWRAYIVLLTVPLVGLLLLIVSYPRAGVPSATADGWNGWFLGTLTYLAVGVPAALFYRKRVCSSYSRGEAVPPRNYLRGMLAVWLALEVGAILSLVGCYMTRSFLPCLATWGVAFVFYITQWPSGVMLVGRAGASEDPQIYETPR
jgi:hypothetical protein